MVVEEDHPVHPEEGARLGRLRPTGRGQVGALAEPQLARGGEHDDDPVPASGEQRECSPGEDRFVVRVRVQEDEGVARQHRRPLTGGWPTGAAPGSARRT